MFEHKNAPLLSREKFYLRIAKSILLGLLITALALVIGMIGYHHFEQMSWIDSFANAAMILSGMGPLTILQTYDGKMFAGFYSLFSGLAFIIALGVIFAPIVHRFMHKFHLQEK